MHAPAAIGDVAYRRHGRARRRVRARRRRAVRRDVHDRAVARHRRRGDGEPPLRARATSTSAPSPPRCAPSTARSSSAACCCRSTRPTWPSSATCCSPTARSASSSTGSSWSSTPSTARSTGIDPSRVRLHVCWGNYEGPHTHDVALDDIQPLLYEAHVGALVVSMANARHAHEHRCFARRPLPDGMLLVTGVIDTTSNYVEHPEVVAERLATVAAVRRRSRAASSPAPTAGSTPPPASATSPHRWCGQKLAALPRRRRPGFRAAALTSWSPTTSCCCATPSPAGRRRTSPTTTARCRRAGATPPERSSNISPRVRRSPTWCCAHRRGARSRRSNASANACGRTRPSRSMTGSTARVRHPAGACPPAP